MIGEERAACDQCEYTQAGKTCWKYQTVKAMDYTTQQAPSTTTLSTYNLDQYDSDIDGCVVLKSGNWVVAIEKYQLKHNPDLSGYLGGGAFKGKKGSTMTGGYSQHQATYAPLVLAAAQSSGYKLGDPILKLKKVRLSDIDAYITVATDNDVIVVNYHGNPP